MIIFDIATTCRLSDVVAKNYSQAKNFLCHGWSNRPTLSFSQTYHLAKDKNFKFSTRQFSTARMTAENKFSLGNCSLVLKPFLYFLNAFGVNKISFLWYSSMMIKILNFQVNHKTAIKMTQLWSSALL